VERCSRLGPHRLAGQSPGPSHPAVGALLRFFRDEDPEVRDWAAFGIGLCEVDGPAIREGLPLLTADPEGDTAGEAGSALAALGDTRVLPVVLERLTRDDVGNLWLEAAAALPDPALLPALRELQATGWFDDDPLGHEWLQQAVAGDT
jgi:HEAT repeat protein